MKKITLIPPILLSFIFCITQINTQKTKKTVPNKINTQEKGPETIQYPEEDIGIQGNWRKKKDWLKQAIEKNDSIQTMATDIQKFKAIFYEKFQPIDKKLDDFYRKSGFDKGELENLIKEIDNEIIQTKSKTKKLFSKALAELDEETKEEATKIKEQYADTYSIEEKFKQYKNNLEQLKLDMQAIYDLDASLRSRLEAAENQVDSITSKLSQAETLSQKIWNVIDDKKAKQIFYELSNIYENTKALQNYIKQDLAQDFDNVITTINNQINIVSTGIDNLEKEGFFVRNRTTRLEQERKKQQELLRQEQKRQRNRKQKEQAEIKQKTPQTWYGLIWDGITSLFSLIFPWLS